MTWILLIGSVLCGWALLRNVGNERERQIRAIEDRIHAEQEAMAALAREKAANSIGGLAKSAGKPGKH
jgi:hypothetical protein